MSARKVLTGLRRRGVKVEAGSGGKLRCSPRSKLGDGDLAGLKQHKGEILDLLAEEAKSPEQHQAEALGLVAMYSRHFGYISLHDPGSGGWFDLPTKDAPLWAVGEARKRKKLYRNGNRKAYRLTSREMEKVWEAEQQEMWEHSAITDRGILYEDYLEED